MEKMIEIQINPKIALEDWSKYVDGHEDATVYHLPGWQKVINKTFGFKPVYIFALNNGKIVGILPIFAINSLLTGKRLVSLPFSFVCGPISDSDEIEEKLLKEAEKLVKDNFRYLEIRSMEPVRTEMPFSDCFKTYQIELDRDSEKVWKKLDKGSVRWAVNKAGRDGVEFFKSDKIEDIQVFYELNQMTKKRLGVPGHPLELFKNIKKYLPGNMELYLAKIDNKIIAGVFNLIYKDMIIYAYGASNKQYLKYHPNNLLIWKAIEDGCNRGYKSFDFGKVGDDPELASFKKRWGTTEKQLYYYFFPLLPQTLSINRQGPKYRFMTAIWKKIPLFFTKKMSHFVFKHLD